MTGKDSVSVKALIDQFFGYVKNKEYANAAGMLYRIDPDNPKGQPILLDNEEMAEVRSMLEMIPMVDYRIEYMKFTDSYENEVLCYVIMQKGTDGMPDISTKMFFRPMDYLGNWCLSIMNTTWGDRGVVAPSERDSIARSYSEQQRDSI